MDWSFASGCSPPRLSATQFPSATDSQCSVRWGLPPHCWCALSGAPSRPSFGREFSDAIAGKIGQPREHRAEVVAERQAQAATSFDDRKDGGNSWSGLFTSDVYPVSSAKSDRAHRVFGQVVAQFQLRIFKEATEPTPKRQRVIAGLGQSAFGQGAGPSRLDARLDLCEQRLAFVQTQKVTIDLV